MSLVALHYQPVPTNYVQVLMKQFTIRGSFEYPPRFEDAIELLDRRDLSALVTHTLPARGVRTTASTSSRDPRTVGRS